MSFVTYKFDNEEDVFTNACRGENPKYDFIHKHELIHDTELTNYL